MTRSFLCLILWVAMWAPSVASGQTAQTGPTGPSPEAAPVRYELHWTMAEGTDSCPGEGAVAAEIATRLGRNPFTHGTEETLHVALSGAPGDWRATLAVHQGDGTVDWSQPLESDDASCYTMADALVLAIVLMIEPAALVAPPELPSEPPVSTPSVSNRSEEESPGEATEEPPAPTEESPSSYPLHGRVGASVSGGLLPRTTAAVRLEVGGPIRAILASVFQWRLTMRFYPQVRTADEDFAFGISTLGLGLCAESRVLERLSLGGCATPSIGVIHGVVYRPEPTFPGDRFWVGLSTVGVASVRVVGPLWVRLEVGGMWSLYRQRFTVRNRTDPAFEQAFAGLDASLSLALRFL